MGRSEYLAEHGLKIVKKYAVVFWDESGGWTTRLVDYEVEARCCGGHSNFTGYSVVECIVPLGENFE